jgi:hypothetical protein
LKAAVVTRTRTGSRVTRAAFTCFLAAPLVVVWLGGCESIAGIKDRHVDTSERKDNLASTAECTSYCNTVVPACKDVGNKQFEAYTTPEACMGVCAALQAGEADAASGNTIACRASNAKTAKAIGPDDLGSACWLAGPAGSYKSQGCGTTCEAYCTLFENVCSAKGHKNTPDISYAECLAKCPALPDLGTYDAVRDSAGDAKLGDTIQCRLYHLSAAATDPSAADTHCPHATLFPPDDTPCVQDSASNSLVPACEDYCTIVQGACSGANAVYETPAQCTAVCKALIADGHTGALGDEGGNTLGCRRYHAYNALSYGVEHCAHAGPGGSGVCSAENPDAGFDDDCGPYCELAHDACPTAFAAAFPDVASCKKSCEAVRGASDVYAVAGATSGNTASCRLLYTSRALATGTVDDALNCPSAVGGGNCH